MFLRFSKSFVLSLTVSAMSITAIMAVPSAALAVEDAGSDADTSECGGTDGNYADAVLAKEGGNVRYWNPGSTATGNYQFLYGTLANLGYIDTSQSTRPAFGAGEWDGVVWTGLDGVNSRMEFVNSSTAQDAALARFTEQNLNAVSSSWTEGQVVNGVPLTSGGVALATHMLGSGGFNTWAASGFSASGLDADIAAAHGWSQDQYLQHLMERVASGGCFDPSMIDSEGMGLIDLPAYYLMNSKLEEPIAQIMPGDITSTVR